MRKAFLAAMMAMGLSGLAAAQTTAPSDDAAAIYNRAAEILKDIAVRRDITSPNASNLSYPEYPPYGDAWTRMEQEDYEVTTSVRRLVRQATTMNHAAWPVFDPGKYRDKNFSYLNGCRQIASAIGDAALYQSLFLDDQPAAFDSAGDVLHLADLLGNPGGGNLVPVLVNDGIQAAATYRLSVIISGVKITTDPSDAHDLPLKTARQWIARLMDHPAPQAEVDQAIKGAPAGTVLDPTDTPSLDRFLEMARRVFAERDMTAMSLAAHVYQFEHGRWPASIDELKTEMPRLPIDPWGNGKQTLGYLLVKGGLPDGSDRPLVYSRCPAPLRATVAADGLFYRTDEPEYGFYNSDGTKFRGRQRTHAGQFRDVARWAPANPTAERSGL